MKSFYSESSGNTQEIVDVIGWDRDKYFLAMGADGEQFTDKCSKFSMKVSKKIYKLPNFNWNYESDCGFVIEQSPTNKDVAKVLKDKRKSRTVYKVYGEKCIKFKSLNKALNYANSNSDVDYVTIEENYKRGFYSGPILEKLNGAQYYFKQSSKTSVSEKTLKKFCISS